MGEEGEQLNLHVICHIPDPKIDSWTKCIQTKTTESNSLTTPYATMIINAFIMYFQSKKIKKDKKKD